MKPKTVYVCTECGYQSAKWLGKCPSCSSWNTLEEYTPEPEPEARGGKAVILNDTEAQPLSALSSPAYIRSTTGAAELDRVLGGGLVKGSAVLLCGEPGIGKSTLLLQICAALAKGGRVLYVSGEESAAQLKLRADRLGVSGNNIYILAETNAETVLDRCAKLSPSVVIIDSVQTMYRQGVNSSAGGVSQVRECAALFVRYAKETETSVILVGHVNKEGTIAGPKILEHTVDTVLYFEGERRQSFRLIRAIKNRFGATDEVGVFEMTEKGLMQVENPSLLLLRGRPLGVSGNCAVCSMEGTRPLVAEIQALVTPSYYPSPKRASTGIDINRTSLLLALLEKRLGLRFSSHDCYLNVVGGLSLDEPSADLAVALALVSSLRDAPVPDDMLAVGELGLAGEVRAVPQLAARIREAENLGFTRVMIPKRNTEKPESSSAELLRVSSIFDAIKALEGK